MKRHPVGDTVEFSRYLRTRECGEWTTVFHELHPEPWYVPAATWRAVQASADQLPPLMATELQQRGLVISSVAQDDQSLVYAEAELARRLDRASVLYLVLVQGCNFT